MSRKSAIDEAELKIGDIVLVGTDVTMFFGVIYGFTPTDQVQLATCIHRPEMLRWPNGTYWNSAIGDDRQPIGYRYGPKILTTRDETHPRAQRMYVLSDAMLSTIQDQLVASRLKEIQAEVISGNYVKNKKKKKK